MVLSIQCGGCEFGKAILMRLVRISKPSETISVSNVVLSYIEIVQKDSMVNSQNRLTFRAPLNIGRHVPRKQQPLKLLTYSAL